MHHVTNLIGNMQPVGDEPRMPVVDPATGTEIDITDVDRTWDDIRARINILSMSCRQSTQSGQPNSESSKSQVLGGTLRPQTWPSNRAAILTRPSGQIILRGPFG